MTPGRPVGWLTEGNVQTTATALRLGDEHVPVSRILPVFALASGV